MRLIKYTGFGIVIISELIFVASSGAFNSMTADRGADIETATDANALVGIEKQPISLEEGGGNFGYNSCLLCGEYYYEHDGVEIIRISDQTSTSELEITEESVNITGTGGNEYPSLEEFEVLRSNNMYMIEGTFRCNAELVRLIEFDQQSVNKDFVVELETSDGTITVELTREISVYCE